MDRFVATDLEGTLSSGEAWRGIAAYLKTHGRARDHQLFFAAHFVPALLARVNLLDKQSFRNQWLVDQAKLLRGYAQPELDVLADWVVENELWAKQRTQVLAELRKHHDAGCTVIIATGAYEPVANAFARRMGLTRTLVLSTPLEMANGRATGNFAGEIGVDALKARRVRSAIGAGQLIAAYGDTAPDAPMLEMSAQPVAVSPDAPLQKIALARGWRVMQDKSASPA